MLAVALGGIGVIVPGLPTTVFFIIACVAFSKSSPRLEAWVLGLPRIGPMVRPSQTRHDSPGKFLATAMIVLFAGGSACQSTAACCARRSLLPARSGSPTSRCSSSKRVLAERAA